MRPPEDNDIEEELSDDEGRDALTTEITQLYDENLSRPTISGIELEKVLRNYLTTADNLSNARDGNEEAEMYATLDILEEQVVVLRAAREEEIQGIPEAGTFNGFVIPGNDTRQ